MPWQRILIPTMKHQRKRDGDMTTEEKTAAKGKHERGNEFFKRNDIDRAIRRYIAAIDYISFDYDFSSMDARRAKERRVPCHAYLGRATSNRKNTMTPNGSAIRR